MNYTIITLIVGIFSVSIILYIKNEVLKVIERIENTLERIYLNQVDNYWGIKKDIVFLAQELDRKFPDEEDGFK